MIVFGILLLWCLPILGKVYTCCLMLSKIKHCQIQVTAVGFFGSFLVMLFGDFKAQKITQTKT